MKIPREVTEAVEKKIMQKMAERAKNKCDGQETQNSHKKILMA